MTGDNIIRMAREAGWTSYDSQDERFKRFAELVRAEEREACANIDWTPILRNNGMVTWGDAKTLADLVSAAIRARGQA